MTSGWSFGPPNSTDVFRGFLGDASIGWAMTTGVPGFFTLRAVSPLLLPSGGAPKRFSFYGTPPC